ncbi:MAG: SLBB domain-containing protein [Calditrichaceae bacterium]|nr:SLBB domain-containing protein [Calditrichaceae bacterium]MBN2708176.1 SLBB domain-containing protein [Calditrichaceae bacterium]RQV97174.1 MAG: hypothetical protein EH224_02275 [Calditrichota bacterium]
MRRKLTLLLTLFTACALYAQTLDDLRNIESIKRELEKISTEPGTKKPETMRGASSLETFQDSLSRLPVQKMEKEKFKPEIILPEEEEEEGKKAVPETTEFFIDLPCFGHEIFEQTQAEYMPEVFGPVDEEYPLGPGDEIIITVWGEVELRHELVINRAGQVYIENVGLVNLSGLNIKEARNKLKSALGRSYSSITKGRAFLDITVGKLRPLRIYVIGNVTQPGVFTVPAVSSPFHLLFYAGGINPAGSLRRVLVARGDEIAAELDFYEFLTAGKRFSNVRLQTNDVVVVPAAEIQVYLDGAVNMPAIYELKQGEGIIELFKYCGGLKDNAYRKTIQVERIVGYEDRRYFDVNYNELVKNNQNFELINGDRILVTEINREVKNYITIEGPIYGPTQFEYHAGLTIRQLFDKVDSIAGDAYLKRVQITRTLPDKKQEMFSLNLENILGGSQPDFALAPEDQIEIKSMTALFPADSVRIYGAVKMPGVYAYKKNMTLKDLIFASGGFTNNALFTEAEVSRIFPRQHQKDMLAQIFYVPLDSSYIKKETEDDGDIFRLLPYDNVFVRSDSEWELQRNVYIEGEVNKPGLYTLETKTTKITDLIERAGGLKLTAYLAGAKLFRSGSYKGQIGIDFEEIFDNRYHEENIFLQAGDRIIIPEKLATVSVYGGVNFPSNVLWEKGEGLDYYIEAAGGYTETGDEDNVTIRLANGRPVQRQRFLFWKYLSDDITAGSTIYVPVLKEKDKTDWSGAIRDAAAILASIATVILIYDQVGK